jgi:cytochrome c5
MSNYLGMKSCAGARESVKLTPSAIGLVLSVLFAGSAMATAPTELTGKEVYDAACVHCHAPNSLTQAAPKLGDQKAWNKRIAQGLSSLTSHALKGIRTMPSHGGDSKLTDVELIRAILYMVNESGGDWVPEQATAPVTVTRSGAEIVQEKCGNCHHDGTNGAPKIGDQKAWIPRLKNGLEGVVHSATKGHDGMPARGGLADLTDTEIRAAVIYLFRGPVAAKP